MASASSANGSRRTFRVLLLLALALSVALPSALLGWVAWNLAEDAHSAAEDTARRTVAVLREHALRTFELAEVLAAQVEARLEGRPWPEARDREAWPQLLERLAATADAVASIGVVDANAVLRASSNEPNVPQISLADREYIQLHRAGQEVVVGTQILGRLSNERFLTLSKRLETPAGAFNGAVLTTIPVEHFTGFWEQFAPSVTHVIPMIRADGEVLVRYRGEAPRRLEPGAPFLRHIEQAPHEGLYTAVSKVDGVERLNAYARVGPYPVYVSFSIETRAIVGAWRRDMIPYAWFTAMAILALLAFSLMLLRFTRAELLSGERWRGTANRLKQEMDRRQAAEEQLRQAQKMEIVGRITGGVAHDFNNLLQVLTNNLTLAERTAKDDASKPFIRAAFQSVERAGRLTKQLLAFSRRQPLDPRPLDVVELLQGMGGLLRTTLGGAIRLELESEPGTWHAMVDRHQAEMAILNLAVNARDAMPAGGSLKIRVDNFSASSPAQLPDLEPGDYVAVSVVDTGSGMAPEVLERVFEPFFTTKDIGKGSGLGLSQVQGFAAQSGGAVDIRSRPGAGTAVIIYLPRARSGHPLVSREARPHPLASGHTETVLLVDDDDAVRKGMAATLEGLGYRVLQAADAGHALQRLGQEAVDILVTDYAMPGMTGAELIGRAREKRRDLRGLLITGYADLPPGERSDVELLHKPFRAEELGARIREILQASPGPGYKAGQS
jgi:two-component system, NtrC family, sensor kinase